jgi:hypothetical protein
MASTLRGRGVGSTQATSPPPPPLHYNPYVIFQFLPVNFTQEKPLTTINRPISLPMNRVIPEIEQRNGLTHRFSSTRLQAMNSTQAYQVTSALSTPACLNESDKCGMPTSPGGDWHRLQPWQTNPASPTCVRVHLSSTRSENLF